MLSLWFSLFLYSLNYFFIMNYTTFTKGIIILKNRVIQKNVWLNFDFFRQSHEFIQKVKLCLRTKTNIKWVSAEFNIFYNYNLDHLTWVDLTVIVNRLDIPHSVEKDQKIYQVTIQNHFCFLIIFTKFQYRSFNKIEVSELFSVRGHIGRLLGFWGSCGICDKYCALPMLRKTSQKQDRKEWA